jgi:uncharacterized protein with von Willebrand factor type A (vWA) domain
MAINDSLNSEKQRIREQLKTEFDKISCDELDKKIEHDISEWEIGVRKSLFEDMPFREDGQKLRHAELDLKSHGANRDSIKDDLDHFKTFVPEEDVSFWIDKIERVSLKGKTNKSDDHSLESIRRNEQEAWRKAYDSKVTNWQLKKIQEARDSFMKGLKDQLKKLMEIKDALEALGIEPGVLWDTSIGTLSSSDISFLKQWAEYLKNDENVKKLCELIGRMNNAQKSLKEEIIKATTTYRTSVPDITSKEEIIGIELGRDLENLVPHEISLMGDDDTAVLFDLKFVENRLMCFSKQGYTELKESLEIEEVQMVEDKRNGPMIICVDTSGSMAGAPENIAKALTLSLSSKAVSQKRNCYLINFSTGIHTMDLTPPKGMNDLIDFLKTSFHGGTDVHPALSHGISMMNKENYEKADMLVISDFVMPDIGKSYLDSMNECREKGCRFYSVSVGDFMKSINSIFDKSWTYDPNTGSINSLNEIIEDIVHIS